MEREGEGQVVVHIGLHVCVLLGRMARCKVCSSDSPE